MSGVILGTRFAFNIFRMPKSLLKHIYLLVSSGMLKFIAITYQLSNSSGILETNNSISEASVVRYLTIFINAFGHIPFHINAHAIGDINQCWREMINVHHVSKELLPCSYGTIGEMTFTINKRSAYTIYLINHNPSNVMVSHILAALQILMKQAIYVYNENLNYKQETIAVYPNAHNMPPHILYDLINPHGTLLHDYSIVYNPKLHILVSSHIPANEMLLRPHTVHLIDERVSPLHVSSLIVKIYNNYMFK